MNHWIFVAHASDVNSTCGRPTVLTALVKRGGLTLISANRNKVSTIGVRAVTDTQY